MQIKLQDIMMHKSTLEELDYSSNRLYFLFGGIGNSLGVPPFEFYKSSQILNHNRIFIRDIYHAWYQNGLPGIATNVYQVGRFLEDKIHNLKPQHVFFVGNSMGGYAAILFASMLGIGKAIAFSPQTFIGPIKSILYRDNRWVKWRYRMYKATIFKKHIYDLHDCFRNNELGYHIDIHFSRNDELDYIHAKRIGKYRNVSLWEYDYGGHKLVRHLRDCGQLMSLLN